MKCSRFWITILLTGTIWSQFALSSVPSDPKPSPPLSSPAPTRQVAELIVTAGCIKAITLAHDGKVHLLLDEKGNPTGEFYFDGALDIDFIPVADRKTAGNCDVTHGVSRPGAK